MNTLIETLNKDADAVSIDRRFGVGVLQGLCLGLTLAIVLLFCGAAIPAVWNWSNSSTKPAVTFVDAKPRVFEAFTVYGNVPFIPLSKAAVRYGLRDAASRKLMEREMISRFYFEQEALAAGTRYVPQLRISTDVRSVATLTNGHFKEAVVQLLNDDGSLGRFGLIPFDEFEDDVKGSLK